MINILEKILAFKQASIKRYPCHSNRASSIGYFVPQLGGCLRRGVYERTQWQQKELHDAKRQLVFDEGHYQEAAVLLDLAAAGISVIEQQTPYEWKLYQITGHIDGKIVDEGEAVPIEIKSMSPNIFEIVNIFEDFKKKSWLRSYMAQITIYMLCQGVDRAMFILKNKSTGMLKQIDVFLDYDLGEWCITAAEEINKHVAAGTLPDKIKEIQTCKECPFKLLCLPNVNLGEELKIKDDPIFEQRIDNYLKLKPIEIDCGKMWELIRSEAKAQAGESGVLNMLIGKYQLTGKLDAKKAFRLEIEKL